LILSFIFLGGRKGKGKGVGASFQLVLENLGSWSFLQVGACKLGGWSLLPVGAGESRELELPSFRLEPPSVNLGGWSLLPVGAGEFREL
jgi:hypothetical protein